MPGVFKKVHKPLSYIQRSRVITCQIPAEKVEKHTEIDDEVFFEDDSWLKTMQVIKKNQGDNLNGNDSDDEIDEDVLNRTSCLIVWR